MRFKQLMMMVMIIVAATVGIHSQDPGQQKPDGGSVENENTFKPCSVGSSLFMFGNFVPGDPPYYGQLNFGYYFTPKDVLIVEGITWTYYEPLGTYGSSEEFYPGKVQAFGIGVGYQRFLWKGFYTSVLVTPFIQHFYNEADEEIETGFQLYLQARVGYRFEFFNKRWFVEPSVALNYWPINTNFPTSFAQIEEGAPKYKMEPGLHFGFRF